MDHNWAERIKKERKSINSADKCANNILASKNFDVVTMFLLTDLGFKVTGKYFLNNNTFFKNVNY